MNGCQTCGGFGYKHDPVAHGTTPEPCKHDWMEFGGPGDEWRVCFLCERVEDCPE